MQSHFAKGISFRKFHAEQNSSFFFNERGIKDRQYSSILNVGITANIFSRGWVTFLGESADFFCLKRNPLDCRRLPKVPLLFQRSFSRLRLQKLGKMKWKILVLPSDKEAVDSP